jgi:hypothetical protein
VAHRKQAATSESPAFSGVFAPLGAAPDGRKTVLEAPSPRHKKFLLQRETWARAIPFLLLSQRTTPKEPHMDETHIEHGQGEPTKAVSQLSESMAHTAESHRALIQEMTIFAKDEGLRFVNLRLERNGQAMDKLQNCHGIPGLIGVQQEWLRDFVQDYMGQNMRLAGALRGLTQNVMACASENLDHAQHIANDLAQETNQQMSHIADEVNTYVQQPVH